MTIGAWRSGMGARQWKRRCIVVETSFCSSSWMTGIASRTVVYISAYPAMFTVHGRFIMIMAIDAGILRIV
jgi:hypothetical protein